MRREYSLTFSILLFSLLIFLFLSEIQARKLEQVCSSSCGDIKNISYPFRLKGDPAGCGSPYFELSCQSSKAILELSSGKYYVKRISYNEMIITLVDINLANGSCSLPYTFLSANELSYIMYYIDSYNYKDPNRTLLSARFLNCSRNIRDPAYTRVPCLSGNQSRVYVTYYGDLISDFPISCSLISAVPIQFPFHVHVGNKTYLSYETIRKFLQSGFDLKLFGPCKDGNPDIPLAFRCNNTAEKDSFAERLESFAEMLLYWLQDMFGSFLSPILKPILSSDSFAEYIEFFVDSTLQEPITTFLTFMFVAVLICRLILAPIVLFVYIIHKYRKTWKIADEVEKFLQNQQSWMPKRYSYAEITAITNHFKDRLGQGGFGSVYKGQLHSGSLIAVKVLENSKFNGEEFINEVSTIGRIHHVNVVQLVGFCSEGSKRALVYEYMPNGSLDRHIFSKKGKGLAFTWEKLHEIAVGTAHGIEYLHKGCDVCILHFDIKPHNILLDNNCIPKISDFGLAKFCAKENDFVSISATRGTIGYIAPELISRNFGSISCKSDVYSYGMLLLEMAGGRRNSYMKATRSSKEYFPSWVYDQINNGEDLELKNATEIEDAIARKLCIIGLWCIQVKPTDRPSMTRVMEMLEGSIDDLQMPPKPFFSSSQHVSIRETESDSSTELLISESMEECLYNNFDV